MRNERLQQLMGMEKLRVKQSLRRQMVKQMMKQKVKYFLPLTDLRLVIQMRLVIGKEKRLDLLKLKDFGKD